MYSYTYKFDQGTLEKILWGNYYYDRNSKKFMNKPSKEFTKRSFVEFILEPIYKIFSHSVSKDPQSLDPILKKLGVYLKKNDYKKDTKPLLKLIFKNFFGPVCPLIDMLAKHIPSA